MVSGLAVVAYDYAAACQHISDGVNGFTAPFDDESAFLAKALLAARSDLEAVREQARASARKVRWKKVVKRFEAQLRELCSQDPESGPAVPPLAADPVSPETISPVSKS